MEMNKAKDKYEKLEKEMFKKKMNMKNLSKQKRFFKKINLLKNKSNLQ